MAGSSLSSSIIEKRYSGPRQIHLPQRQAPRGAELHGQRGLVQRIQRAHTLRRSGRVLHTSQKQTVFCVHFCQLYALLRNLNELGSRKVLSCSIFGTE
ncbi:hypothetical protein PI124_g19545 [Phytophthora idaei]|nr:hypothetical protein PI126_g15660 [Phytophthora idaei]KAG3235422.1 hypothetical protein PI124_g19545 [Phytophthora idaei]